MSNYLGLLGSAVVLGVTIRVMDEALEPLRKKKKGKKEYERRGLFSW